MWDCFQPLHPLLLRLIFGQWYMLIMPTKLLILFWRPLWEMCPRLLSWCWHLPLMPIFMWVMWCWWVLLLHSWLCSGSWTLCWLPDGMYSLLSQWCHSLPRLCWWLLCKWWGKMRVMCAGVLLMFIRGGVHGVLAQLHPLI